MGKLSTASIYRIERRVYNGGSDLLEPSRQEKRNSIVGGSPYIFFLNHDLTMWCQLESWKRS